MQIRAEPGWLVRDSAYALFTNAGRGGARPKWKRRLGGFLTFDDPELVAEDSRNDLSPDELAALDELDADLAFVHAALLADPRHAEPCFARAALHGDDATAMKGILNAGEPRARGGYVHRAGFLFEELAVGIHPRDPDRQLKLRPLLSAITHRYPFPG